MYCRKSIIQKICCVMPITSIKTCCLSICDKSKMLPNRASYENSYCTMFGVVKKHNSGQKILTSKRETQTTEKIKKRFNLHSQTLWGNINKERNILTYTKTTIQSLIIMTISTEKSLAYILSVCITYVFVKLCGGVLGKHSRNSPEK